MLDIIIDIISSIVDVTENQVWAMELRDVNSRCLNQPLVEPYNVAKEVIVCSTII